MRPRRDLALALGVSALCSLLVLVLGGVAVVLVTATTQAPTFAGAPRFVVTWPDAGDLEDEQSAVRRAGEVTAAVTDLNAAITLPQHVEVRVGSCGFGTSYDTGARRIDLCVDEAETEREELDEVGDPDPDGTVRRVWRETTMHEAAHAVIDLLDLDHEGTEEDAADQFAAWMLLRDGEVADAAALVAAATQYDAWAELYEPSAKDEHAPDATRAQRYACWVWGAVPSQRDALVGLDLDERRAAGCAEEWADLEDEWTGLLADAGALRR